MRKFRTQYLEPEEYIDAREENNLPSLTEPNMSLTPREVLDRFASGRPVEQSSDLVYTGEEYYPDLRSMDIVEIDDFMVENQSRIAALRDQIKDAKKQRKKLAESKKTEEQSDSDDGQPA